MLFFWMILYGVLYSASSIYLDMLLYWNQDQHRVYSDSFIRIQQEDQILTGYGFESNESLTKYKIFKIKGVFPMDSEEEGLNNQE